MIADLILAVCGFMRTTFCIHDYKPHLSPAHWATWDECRKCGRVRDFSH
jgi:hypothetical protein